MIEILIESLCSNEEFIRIKRAFTLEEEKVRLGACIQDHLLMVDTTLSVCDICNLLEDSGFHVSGVAVLEHESVDSMAKFHGNSYIQ